VFVFPLSIDTVQRYVASPDLLDDAPLLHLSALMLLMRIDSPAMSHGTASENAERLMQQLSASFLLALDDARALVKQGMSGFSAERVYRKALALDLTFVEANDEADVLIEAAHPSKGWSPDFSQSYLQRDIADTVQVASVFRQHSGLTEDQVRLINAFAAEPEETAHVEAVAGAGKTHLISLMSQVTPADETLVLAQSQSHFSVLRKRMPHLTHFKTFGQVALEVARFYQGLKIPELQTRYDKNYTLSWKQLAELFACYPIGKLNAEEVAGVAFQTVTRFCNSADERLSVEHFPKRIYHDRFNPDYAVILTLANAYWQHLLYPTGDIKLPVRGYHLIKHWSLSDRGFPSEFKFIFIDEMHDLPPVINRLIEKSDASVITLGDSYQSLNFSQTNAFQQNGGALRSTKRVRNITTSYRTGAQSEGVFQACIDKHPFRASPDFHGRMSKITALKPYAPSKQASMFDSDTATLIGTSAWTLLKYASILFNKGASFKFHPTSRRDLSWLVAQAILFHKRQSYRASHPSMTRFETWDLYFESLQPYEQRIVDQTIGRGYNDAALGRMLDFESTVEQGAYTLAYAEHTKNHEFDNVVLLDDLLSLRSESAIDKAKALNQIYIAASRGRNQIYVPESLNGFLDNAF